jgi:DNA (cytosine-5)-methyltransferase 1
MELKKPSASQAAKIVLQADFLEKFNKAANDLYDIEDGPYAMYEDEIAIDLFCGAGGTSTGIQGAIGESPMFALNHNHVALGVHGANHPDTIHLESDVFAMDPAEHVPQGRRVGILSASPSCVHFSTARGGAPLDREIRDQAWVVCERWAEHADERFRPRVIIVENVAEFRGWAPLTGAGKVDKRFIDKNKLGSIFKEWRDRIVAAGYTLEYRVLNAAEYGVATKRKRLLVVARRDGLPIRFPVPTHGPRNSPQVKAGLLKPYDTAANHIDFTIRCNPIFMYAQEAKKAGCIRPLADNTLKRIAAGVEKFVIEAAEPYIIPYYGAKSGENSRARPVSEPLPTQTTENRFCLVSPLISPITHSGAARHYLMDGQLPTITGAHRGELAYIASICSMTERTASVIPMRRDCSPVGMDEPVPALATHAQMALAIGGFSEFDASPFFVGAGGGAYAGKPRTADDALNTVTCESRLAVVMPSLINVNHGDVDRTGKRRGQSNHDLQEPLPTQTKSNGMALVAPRLSVQPMAAAMMVQTGYGERAGQAPRCLDIEEPIGTMVAGGGKHAVVTAAFAPMPSAEASTMDTGMHRADALCGFDAAVRTGTPAEAGDFISVTAPFVTNNNTNRLATGIEEPVPSMTTGNQQIVTQVGMVQAAAFVGQENFDDAGSDARDPLSTMTLSPHQSIIQGGLASTSGAAVFMAQNNAGKVGHPMMEPVSTMLGSVSHQSVVSAGLAGIPEEGAGTAFFMAQHNAENIGHGMNDPVSTMTTKVCHQNVVASHIMTLRQNTVGQELDKPITAFCAAGNHHAEIRTSLVRYFDQADADPSRMVEVSVEDLGLTEEQRYEAWWIARFLEVYGTRGEGDHAMRHFDGPRPSAIGRPGAILWTVEMRMLVPKEAFSASSFPKDYQFEFQSDGTPTTKTQQMALVGNAVPPGLAQAIIGANMRPRPSVAARMKLAA